MRVLKAIALLMHYPDGSVRAHSDELIALLESERRLAVETRRALAGCVREHRARDLLEEQAAYGALFDRGNALSLHLFEHVHGESRDRGQAMVQLLGVYREHGFDIRANELPDYVPLFLEFCAQLPEEQARGWLAEVEHLLQLLHGRLEERGSDYRLLFQALLELAGLGAADAQLKSQIEAEDRDDTPEALDRAWAEEPVIFGPTDGCGGARTNQGQEVPVDWSNLRRHRA